MKKAVSLFNKEFRPGDYLIKSAYQYEIPLAIVSLISILLILTTSINLHFLVTVCITTLSLMYYFMAFSKAGLGKPPSPYAVFIRKIMYISFAVSALGTLFYFSYYSGSMLMNQMGMISILGTLLSYFFLRIRVPEIKLISGADTRRLLFLLVIDLFVAIDLLNINAP